MFTLRDLFVVGVTLVVLIVSILFVREKTPSFFSRANSADAHIQVPGPTRRSFQVRSPDGAKKLSLQSLSYYTATQSSHILKTADSTGEDSHIVYKAVLPIEAEIRLPENSWSPDNKFVFVFQEVPGGFEVLLFHADGQLYSDGASYVDVTDEFRVALPESRLRDVTGWDDPALLHVMTYNTDGEVGPSYRFDVWSRNFYRISHR